ncbi:CEP295 N-terminal-like protein isoform X1 [Canis aureus]
MKRNADRAARLSPSPDHEAPLLRQKQRLLQVREKGALALQRRPDLQPWKSQQPQCQAEELKAGWQEAPPQQVRGLERPYLAHLLGVGGGQAREHQPDSDGPAQRGAAQPQRAGERHRAAAREARSRREDLVRPRPQPWRTKPQRKAVGAEKPGAPRAAGLTHRPRCAPEKIKGKRVPSTKTSCGRRPADPRGSRGMDVEELGAAAGELERLQKREKEGGRDGRRQPGQVPAPPGQGPKSSGLDPSPEGRARDLEELWLGGWTCRGASPCRCGDRSRWQRELEFAFQELFNTNQELKRHLSLHLAPGPRVDQSSSAEHGLSQAPQCRGDTPRDRSAAGTGVDVGPRGECAWPVPAEARQTASHASADRFRSRLESHRYHRVARLASRSESKSRSPKAGAFIGGESRLLCSPGSGPAPARLDPLAEGPHRPCPAELVDGGSPTAWWQRPGRWQEPVRPTGSPGLSWEARALPEPRAGARAGRADRTEKGVPG